LVVTPNFDDFLSRALVLFGVQPVVSDHPETIPKIDLRSRDLQVVHIHGTYWFYDCANLSGEIRGRAQQSDSPFSMRDFLDRLLSERSPLIVGYSGWKEDVFMTALRRRLQVQPKRKMYWFCHTFEEVAAIFEALRHDPRLPCFTEDICFVCVPAQQSVTNDSSQLEIHAAGGQPGDEADDGKLSATRVFDELNRVMKVDDPPLIKSPFQFFIDYFSKAAPRGPDNLFDVYFRGVIDLFKGVVESGGPQRLEPIRAALRAAQYRKAIKLAVRLQGLDPLELSELMAAMRVAAGSADDSESEIEAYRVIENCAQSLQKNGRSSDIDQAWAESLRNRAATLAKRGEYEAAIGIYNEVIQQFGNSADLPVCQLVASSLRNKAIALRTMNRNDEALAVYVEIVNRYGASTQTLLLQQVAIALRNKASALEAKGQSDQAIAVYDEVITRFGRHYEIELRLQLAVTFRSKTVALARQDRHEAAVGISNQLIEQFGRAAEAAFVEEVARAFIAKAGSLQKLKRDDEAVDTLDEMILRFGQVGGPAVRQLVAIALFNKGIMLEGLNKEEEAISVYEELIRRFDSATELVFHEIIAQALLKKGDMLTRLKSHQALTVYDDLIERFASRDEVLLQEEVAQAIFNKGEHQEQSDNYAEAHNVYRELVERFGEYRESTRVAELVTRARQKLTGAASA
jgi:tetratricopeptide (TPR) repeat protein